MQALKQDRVLRQTQKHLRCRKANLLATTPARKNPAESPPPNPAQNPPQSTAQRTRRLQRNRLTNGWGANPCEPGSGLLLSSQLPWHLRSSCVITAEM